MQARGRVRKELGRGCALLALLLLPTQAYGDEAEDARAALLQAFEPPPARVDPAPVVVAPELVLRGLEVVVRDDEGAPIPEPSGPRPPADIRHVRPGHHRRRGTRAAAPASRSLGDRHCGAQRKGHRVRPHRARGRGSRDPGARSRARTQALAAHPRRNAAAGRAARVRHAGPRPSTPRTQRGATAARARVQRRPDRLSGYGPARSALGIRRSRHARSARDAPPDRRPGERRLRLQGQQHTPDPRTPRHARPALHADGLHDLQALDRAR